MFNYFNLQLFSEESPSTQAADVTAALENVSETATESPESSGSESEAETSTVAEVQNAQPESFKDLIKGPYKEAFHAETQRIINKRFKDVKVLEEKAGKLGDLTDRLMQMYGASSLDEAIEKMEKAYIAEQAYNNGMSEEQYRMIVDAERIQNQRAREIREQEEKRYIDETIQRWTIEAEEMKTEYPDFDLKTEIDNNEKFLDLIKSGVTVKAAYEVANLDAIKEKAKTEAESKLTATIQSQKSRPKEAALSAGGSAGVKIDVSNLSAEQRKEMAQRARRGENIKF